MLKSKTGRYAFVIAVILAIWQLLSMLLKLNFLPSPVAVFSNLPDAFSSGMAIHSVYSLWRVFAGIIASVIIGVPIGFLMGYSPKWGKILSPAVYFTYPIPKIALLPLVMLLFGLGELSKIIMITMIVVFQVIVASRDAVKSIPKETFYSMTSLGASTANKIGMIVIPASLPYLFSSLRISLGTALSVLFFTEIYGTRFGMGYYIMDSWTRVNYADMFSGILVLSVMGLLLFALIDLFEKLFCRWRKED